MQSYTEHNAKIALFCYTGGRLFASRYFYSHCNTTQQPKNPFVTSTSTSGSFATARQFPPTQLWIHLCTFCPLRQFIATKYIPSRIAGFVTLVEPSIENLVVPSVEPRPVSRARPMPAVAHQLQVNIHEYCAPPPLPVIPHPQTPLMMFGALAEHQKPLVLPIVPAPGPVPNFTRPQNVNNHQNPAIVNASVHQLGNALAFHALAEDLPPRELFDS